jgi:signal transduction histidine kinase
VFDEAGQRSGAVTVHQDISTLKELEHLREEWSSIVAHDLRQPAGVITIGADMLARTLDERHGEEALKIVHHIRRSAKRLKQMIGDLLDMSRIEAAHLSLERADTELVSWLDETVERLAVLAPDHEVRLRTGVRQAIVSIDPARIEQVLGNLIGNAAQYGDPGADITIGLDQRDGEFEISVSNRGGGILPSELPNLFQRFRRGGAARHAGIAGLGVGLYICKGLVEAHGGRIWADSTPGETTTFAFTLPASSDALPGQNPARILIAGR